MRTPLDTRSRLANALTRLRPRRLLALIALSVLGWSAVLVGNAQTAVPAPSKATSVKPATAASAPVNATKPEWAELNAAQKTALAPLQSSWAGISSGQKRKWIAMSAYFANLSPTDQAKMHGRMTEWTALGPEQRRQARLNFAQTKDVPLDEKKAQWNAYQALSPEQTRQLAADAPGTPGGAARAVTPVAPAKLAAVPVTRSEPAHPASAARPHVVRPLPPKPLAPASALPTRP